MMIYGALLVTKIREELEWYGGTKRAQSHGSAATRRLEVFSDE